jgi:hypothetical protein
MISWTDYEKDADFSLLRRKKGCDEIIYLLVNYPECAGGLL